MDDYLIPPERYEGDGFVLRGYEPGDGAMLAEATTASYEHLRPFMEWAVPEQSAEEGERLARRFRARWLLAEDFTIAILSPDERRLLGGTGFHLWSSSFANRAAEIGMWIRASEAGRGLGTAVLRAVLDWGFTQWPWERLLWRCVQSNVASARVAERAGMRLEGVQRGYKRHEDEREDMRLYSLLKSEWEEQR